MVGNGQQLAKYVLVLIASGFSLSLRSHASGRIRRFRWVHPVSRLHWQSPNRSCVENDIIPDRNLHEVGANMGSVLTSGLITFLLTESLLGDAAKESIAVARDDDRLLSISNEHLSVGIDLDHGGAITWFSAEGDEAPSELRGINFINNFDLGRQIQMSHYAPPNPFEPPGKTAFRAWKKLGWNAVQAGDHFGNGSKVLDSSLTDNQLFVRSRPMQWPLDDVPSEAIFEMTVAMAGPLVRVDCSVDLDRTDEFVLRVTPHEVPAVYVISEFSRIVVPQGEGLKRIKQDVPNKWTHWKPDAPWAALLNEDDFGVGIYSPAARKFTGGLHGEPGQTDVASTATTYVAPVAHVELPRKGRFEYSYWLTVGSLSEISTRFTHLKHTQD